MKITHGSDRPDLDHELGAACELCAILNRNSIRANRQLIEKSARMVQQRHLAGETGYSVIAECDYDPHGAEVGFYPGLYQSSLHQARERGRTLKRDRTKWMSNQIGWIFIYDVTTCQIIEEVYND
jgi:hypothetical protein